MLLFNLLLGCGGLILAGKALTRFIDTRDTRWATAGIIEMLIGIYFIVACLGIANSQ